MLYVNARLSHLPLPRRGLMRKVNAPLHHGLMQQVDLSIPTFSRVSCQRSSHP
uniref:Uncharacterized protein n=1 Tax=Picea sitchensis TaxID=3332 RepID=A0A6B9XUG3_PICSI|nr:hypothetical protein Q903MT_gene5784 [Picea sitchensis]